MDAGFWGALAVEEAFFDKEASNGVGDVEVSCGSAAEVDADVFLSDENKGVVGVLHKVFHEGTFARASYAGDDGDNPFGYVYTDVLKIVKGGILDVEESGGGAEVGFERCVMAEHASGDSIGVEQLVEVAFEGDVAAVVACSRTEVDDVVCHGDNLTMVFYNEDGVAVVAEVAEGVFEAADVLGMEADAGFIEDIGHVGEGRVDVFCYFDALSFATTKGAGSAAEGEVTKADVAECLESFAQFVFQV